MSTRAHIGRQIPGPEAGSILATSAGDPDKLPRFIAPQSTPWPPVPIKRDKGGPSQKTLNKRKRLGRDKF